MTALVILILIAIWVAVLIYPLIRARTEGGLGDSIGSFRRHLSVLERAAPRSVSPANRLRVPIPQSPQAGIPPYRSLTAGRGRTSPGGRRVAGPKYSTSAATARRRQAQRRRRDVLFALLAGTLGSLLLGLIPGLSMMLYVFFGFVLLFFGYIALLIRLRTLATEREMKLTFLPGPTPRAGYSSSAGERQRAAGGAYTLPAGYGSASDLLMRRPAN
ncbi:MAG TPA: hypothetical protein VLL25_00455 [Acidimicrobiales bacterium]|nr:hypothetical protein [Acidimicrobiales bacterium]